LKALWGFGRSRLKIVACIALALLVAGCIPIGARVSNMYTAQALVEPL